MNEAALVIDGLTVLRGGAAVVRDVSLTVPSGSVTALLGANGAGKTSLLEAVSGVASCTGQIFLDGVALVGKTPGARARLGLAHVEQGRTVFGAMTVEQNLMVVADRGRRELALEAFPELFPLRHRRAELLSGGQQQMLVIARALAQRPRYLLIDELSLGLAPSVVARLLPAVRGLADDGVGVLLVEQFAYLALDCADHAAVLARGEIAVQGPASQLASSPDLVRSAYLGTSEATAAQPRTEEAAWQ